MPLRPVAVIGASYVFGGPGATSHGIITGPGSKSTFSDLGFPVSLQSDVIATHGPAPHVGATIVLGSTNTVGVAILAAVSGAEEKPLTRVGDLASCGCTVQNGDAALFN